MKKCTRCGNINPDDTGRCLKCGELLYDWNKMPDYYENNQNQGSYYQPPVAPQPPTKKKSAGKGCLVTICIAIFILAVFAMCSTILSDSSDTDSKSTTQSQGEQTTEKTPDVADFTVNEEIIYDKNDVIIKVTNTNISSSKIGLNFYIENNSNLSLHFCIHSSAVNNIMTKENIYSMSTDVAPSKKANATFSISRSWFEDNNITKIKSFELLFWAYDNDKSYKKFETEVITIKTNHYDEKVPSYKNSIYNKNGIQIYSIGQSSNSITFAVYNKNSFYVDYDLKDTSINNWSLDTGIDVYDEPLFSNCFSVFTIEFDNEFKEQNGIDKIETAEFKLEYRIKGDHFDSKSTDIVKYKSK